MKGITPIVLYFHAGLLNVFLSSIKFRLYCQLNMLNTENIEKILSACQIITVMV